MPYTDGACTEEEILETELVVLKSLNWGLTPMTPNAWMRVFMQILYGPRQPNSHAFTLPAYSGLPFSRAMQVRYLPPLYRVPFLLTGTFPICWFSTPVR